MDSAFIKKAVVQWCIENKMYAVTECSFGHGVADVVAFKRVPVGRMIGTRAITPNWLQEFEVKVTKVDLRNDLKKKKWAHYRSGTPFTHFTYVVPRELREEAEMVAMELEDMLRSEAVSDIDKGWAPNQDRKQIMKARVGVLVVRDDGSGIGVVDVAKKSVRFKKWASPSHVEVVVRRSFWELYRHMGLRT